MLLSNLKQINGREKFPEESVKPKLQESFGRVRHQRWNWENWEIEMGNEFMIREYKWQVDESENIKDKIEEIDKLKINLMIS